MENSMHIKKRLSRTRKLKARKRKNLSIFITFLTLCIIVALFILNL